MTSSIISDNYYKFEDWIKDGYAERPGMDSLSSRLYRPFCAIRERLEKPAWRMAVPIPLFVYAFLTLRDCDKALKEHNLKEQELKHAKEITQINFSYPEPRSSSTDGIHLAILINELLIVNLALVGS